MLRFEGKKALVTGGSRGIGKAITLMLASGGADVAINYEKDENAAAETAALVAGMGRRCITLKADISDHVQIKTLLGELKDQFGSLDILVSNAVSGVLGPAARIGRLGWERAMNTNARSFMLLVQKTVKLFPEKGGRIVAVSSIGSVRCLPGYAAVGASKAALEALVRYFAKELAPSGINVNAVSGGPVETSALDYFPGKDEIVAEWKGRTPSGRIASPEDIAPVVGFLLSDDASWIQGQTIVADGGLTL